MACFIFFIKSIIFLVHIGNIMATISTAFCCLFDTLLNIIWNNPNVFQSGKIWNSTLENNYETLFIVSGQNNIKKKVL